MVPRKKVGGEVTPAVRATPEEGKGVTTTVGSMSEEGELVSLGMFAQEKKFGDNPIIRTSEKGRKRRRSTPWRYLERRWRRKK